MVRCNARRLAEFSGANVQTKCDRFEGNACTFDAQCRSTLPSPIGGSLVKVNENETCGEQVSENGELELNLFKGMNRRWIGKTMNGGEWGLRF
ncbi:MAG: hypothetical protein ACTS7I_00860 [Candidatus Hodgkinia cicadicola]